MNIIKYNDRENVEEAIAKDEPLLAVISFDGKIAVVAHVDEAVEHHILLNKAGLGDTNIDKYFRIIFDKEGCDWTRLQEHKIQRSAYSRVLQGRFRGNRGFSFTNGILCRHQHTKAIQAAF